MSRYIDAMDIAKQIADFKRVINSPNSDYMTGYICALSATEGMIANAMLSSTADVAEVVRCKDCKHRYSPRGDDAYLCGLNFGIRGLVAEEDFCSYGERKDEAIRSAIEEWNGKRDKSCDNCAFYNEDRDNQPCCYCAEHSCWVKGEEDDT